MNPLPDTEKAGVNIIVSTIGSNRILLMIHRDGLGYIGIFCLVTGKFVKVSSAGGKQTAWGWNL